MIYFNVNNKNDYKIEQSTHFYYKNNTFNKMNLSVGITLRS